MRQPTVLFNLVVPLAIVCATPFAAAQTPAEPVSIVKASVARLKVEAEKMGVPRIAGTEQIAGKDVPSVYFGQTRISNNADVAADLAARAGGSKLTVYAKSGDKFTAVASNIVLDGGRLLMGQPLFIGDKPEATLRAGEGVYGGRTYLNGSRASMMSGFEPIKDGDGAVIGVYNLLLSPMQYCEATRTLFPHGGARPLLFVDGKSDSERKGMSELVDCETVALSWFDGCNRNEDGASITPGGDVKRTGAGSTTLMACTDPSIEPRARAMNVALSSMSHWRVDGRNMLILEGGGHELIFGPEK